MQSAYEVKSWFISVFNQNIKREGADKLLAFLERSDFFTAPASARFHLACEGGLALHSLNVYARLLEFAKTAAAGTGTDFAAGALDSDGPSLIEQSGVAASAAAGAAQQQTPPHGLNFSPETLAICGLLHDVCKTETYTMEMRNVKVENVWVQRPYYSVNDRFPFGHGEKSVYIIERFMRLTNEEAMAINWHMGGFDDRARGGSYSVSEAFARYKLCVILHSADLFASYLDESRAKKA